MSSSSNKKKNDETQNNNNVLKYVFSIITNMATFLYFLLAWRASSQYSKIKKTAAIFLPSDTLSALLFKRRRRRRSRTYGHCCASHLHHQLKFDFYVMTCIYHQRIESHNDDERTRLVVRIWVLHMAIQSINMLYNTPPTYHRRRQ